MSAQNSQVLQIRTQTLKSQKTQVEIKREEETRAKTEMEGVYLQGRGGGTPKSAKSGSEERAEEGQDEVHSFLMQD